MTNEIKVTKTNSGWTVECGAWFSSHKTKKSAVGMGEVYRSWLAAGFDK